MKPVTVRQWQPGKQSQGQAGPGSARNNKSRRESPAGLGWARRCNGKHQANWSNTKTWGEGNVRIELGVWTQSYIDHSIHTNTPTYGTVNIFMVGSVGDLFLANVTISWARARPWHLTTIGPEEAPIYKRKLRNIKSIILILSPLPCSKHLLTKENENKQKYET